MIYTTTFLDFIDETKFLKLQNKFASIDVRSNPYEDSYSNIVYEDFTVIEKDINIETNKDTYTEKSFYKDFIIPSLSTLAKRYIRDFQFKTEKMFEEKRVEAYVKHQLNKFLNIESQAKKIPYLNQSGRDLLFRQIEKVIEYLSDNHMIPSFSLDNKMKMKMNKTDIIVLFLLLRENNKISYYSNTEFRLMLEKSFQYFNIRDKEYQDISTKSTTISDILNGNKPIKKTLKRLKNLFNDDNFYKALDR